MSVEQHQTPPLEEPKPQKTVKRRGVLRYLLATFGTTIGLEWNYRIFGRYLESFPLGSIEQRVGFGERLILKAIQDQFPGEKDSQISQAWWKYNIAQITALNNGHFITAAALYAFLFNKGKNIDISNLYTEALLSDPFYKNVAPQQIFPSFVQDQLKEGSKIVVTNLPQDPTGKILRGSNIRCGVPVNTAWSPQIRTQLRDHILYVSAKIQSINHQHLAQPPPITGPPKKGKISVLTSDAQVIIFKSFTAQSAAGYEVNQEDLHSFTTNLLNRSPITLNQEWLKSQTWYQEILHSGFSLTPSDAQTLIDSGNAYPFEIWNNQFPTITTPLAINLP